MRSNLDKSHKTVRLPEILRDELAKPRGTLVKGKEDEVSRKVSDIIRRLKPRKVITVGDVVTRSMISVGVRPDLSIIDGKTLRGPEEKIDYIADKTHRLINPAGLIVSDAWKVIGKALKEKKKIKIIVEGEEDLLGIPVALLAPKGSLMLYGQPNEGIVIVTVNDEIREFTRNILSQMEEEIS
jgi:uncharacterized protein (UPF0218 family)